MPKKGYFKSKTRIEISIGESVRIARELNQFSQSELARITGIPQSTISGIEMDRIKLGAERAKVLARALHCHPAVLLFPAWQISGESAA
ncbi:MAG: helix-turn-helix transcriptional regulator [Nitrospirae bacterium]|nr:helix-turn-helix transcriptional regulator [Nitrospirota bacterium]MBI3352167.1 helix-turn-helix transcriptional regulator [Nitrospirota bacterium]